VVIFPHFHGRGEIVDASAKQPNWVLGIVGAIGAGVLGYVIFFLLANQGLYAIVLPAAAPGLGGGALLRGKSTAFGIVCAILGVVLALFAEWRFAPFIVDSGFLYFATHLHQLSSATLILIAIGVFCGFWFGQGRVCE
jgi:hypothetical protein